VTTLRYLYAITDGPGPALGATGLQGAAVDGVSHDGLVMAASTHSDLRLRPEVDDLWAHEAVVEALLDGGGAVLPMRFGTTVPDDNAIRAILHDREDEWRNALDRVRGAIELGVRAVIDTEEGGGEAELPSAASDGPGTRYLLERLGRDRRITEVAQAVHGPLSGLARASRHTVRDRPTVMMKGAYLVDSRDVPEFEAAAARLDDEIAAASIACTGPWPPYSFSAPAR
jgi:hypothetical protein